MEFNEKKQTHFKTWKSGKKWLYVATTFILIIGAGSFGPLSVKYVVHADDITINEQETSSSSSDQNPKNEQETSSSSSDQNPKNEQETRSSASDQNPKTEQETRSSASDQNPKNEQETRSSASDQNPKTEQETRSSASDQNPKNEQETRSSSIEKKDTTHKKSQSNFPSQAQVNYKSLLNQVSNIGNKNLKNISFTHVTKDNFLNYFSLNGDATYDASTGIVTLTTDDYDKVGNFSLNSKIDMNTSFTLTGQINLGSKTSNNWGADGISFAFHSGNTTDIGNSGGNLGIGGLQDAIGFKLDTWHNDSMVPQSPVDGAKVSPNDSNGFGWSGDPDGEQYPQFGAFVNTTDQQIKASDGKEYQRWWAEVDSQSVQALDDKDLDGNFHDYIVSYDGETRILTVSYTQTSGNVLTWSKKIDSSYEAMAMVMSASTGGASNLQQFKISGFDFKQAATVNVKYVDTKGNQIAQGQVEYPSGANVNGEYNTQQLQIPHYQFIKMDDGSIIAKSIAANGTLEKSGDNGTVIYVYSPIYTTAVKTVNETIHYVDTKGKTVAPDYQAAPVHFLTVTNPLDGTTTTYYSTTTTSEEVNNDGEPTSEGWIKADQGTFGEVSNPEVKNYKMISNNAPGSDLTKVATQNVDFTTKDLDFTVVYSPIYTTAVKTVNETIHYVDTKGKTVAPDYQAAPVHFLTVTNPLDGTTTTYYSTTTTSEEVNNDGEPTSEGWIKADRGTFGEVSNPEVKNYKVISNNAPGSDLTKVATQNVDFTTKDLDFTVVYGTKAVLPKEEMTTPKPPESGENKTSFSRVNITNSTDQTSKSYLPTTGASSGSQVSIGGFVLLLLSSIIFGFRKKKGNH